MRDSLGPEIVGPRLAGAFGRPYVFRERCASTQRLFAADAPEGAVAVAEEQSEGRGRLGRRWVAPARTSLLVSILLRPQLPVERWPELTLVAACACLEAIERETGLKGTLKEPNDVLLAGRKVAGVLGEAQGERVVLGIGVNVNVAGDDLPTDVETPATSLLAELGREADRASILVTLLERLEVRYREWLASPAREVTGRHA